MGRTASRGDESQLWHWQTRRISIAAAAAILQVQRFNAPDLSLRDTCTLRATMAATHFSKSRIVGCTFIGAFSFDACRIEQCHFMTSDAPLGGSGSVTTGGINVSAESAIAARIELLRTQLVALEAALTQQPQMHGSITGVHELPTSVAVSDDVRADSDAPTDIGDSSCTPTDESAPATALVRIRPRKLAFLGSSDTGKSTLMARLLARSTDETGETASADAASLTPLLVRHLVSTTAALLSLHRCYMHFFTHHRAFFNTIAIDTPELRIVAQRSAEMVLQPLVACAASDWLHAESYPDMCSSLTAARVHALNSLWHMHAWSSLLHAWPVALYQLWPLFLLSQRSSGESDAAVAWRALMAQDTAGHALLTTLFTNSRISLSGVCASAVFLRDSLLPRMVQAAASVGADDLDASDCLQSFRSEATDAYFLSDATRGLVQRRARLSLAFDVPAAATGGVAHDEGIGRPRALLDALTSTCVTSAPTVTGIDSDAASDVVLLDVGGRRAQLKNWQHIVCDPEFDVCVFALSLDSYAAPCIEDGARTDRMHDALCLFERTFGTASSSPVHRRALSTSDSGTDNAAAAAAASSSSASSLSSAQPPFTLVAALTHADQFGARHTNLPFHKCAPPIVLAAMRDDERCVFEDIHATNDALVAAAARVLQRCLETRAGGLAVHACVTAL